MYRTQLTSASRTVTRAVTRPNVKGGRVMTRRQLQTATTQVRSQLLTQLYPDS